MAEKVRRPRRFGKTLNMSMLKCFFETGSDGTIFDGLEISKEKELCVQYMGKFPVIAVSLKNVESSTLDGARLVIPNKEIRWIYIEQIQEWFEEESTRDRQKLEKFCRAFLENDIISIEKVISG